MSTCVTAEVRVSVTVLPEMATPPEATRRRAPFTVTRKAPGDGSEPVSRVSVKVILNVFPSTAAFWSALRAGGEPLGKVPPGSTGERPCER